MRLYYAPFDLRDGRVSQHAFKDIRNAPEILRKLFLRYVSDMERVSDDALEAWIALVQGQLTGDRSLAEARRAAFAQWPAGPASQADVVSTVRNYWLEVADIVADLGVSADLLPQDLLLKWPSDVRKDHVVAVITAMPYWPIGLDENGNWC